MRAVKFKKSSRDYQYDTDVRFYLTKGQMANTFKIFSFPRTVENALFSNKQMLTTLCIYI